VFYYTIVGVLDLLIQFKDFNLLILYLPVCRRKPIKHKILSSNSLLK